LTEAIIEIPDDMDLDIDSLDKDMLKEALEALKSKKASQARAREKRDNMTEEEKAKVALAAKVRRAKIVLQVKFAEKNGYLPSDDEANAYLAAL